MSITFVYDIDMYVENAMDAAPLYPAPCRYCLLLRIMTNCKIFTKKKKSNITTEKGKLSKEKQFFVNSRFEVKA